MARFRVWPLDTVVPMLRGDALRVNTRAGLVTASESEFSVTTRADTTVVQVHPLGRRRAVQPNQRPVLVTAQRPGLNYHLMLRDLEGARLVLGRDTEHIINHR